ncbi:redoxin domain-containing protein [Streptomyces sp. GD-15H]|uniref:TlpA family protein disulfide reductase n=1 Tax=Streptomyces sp. GD-15H TaxID=3129112 RepID=UPI00324A52CB
MPNFPLTSGCPGIPRRAAVAAPAAASPDHQRLTHPAVEDRTAAPENRGETLTGKPINLADHRGKTLATNVRGSWCAAEAPHPRKVSEDLRDQDTAFLKTNTHDATKDVAHRFKDTYGLTCPSLGDRNGRQLPKVKGTLPPPATPTTLVIDHPGRVAARRLQGLSETELRSLTDPVLKEG